MWIALFLITGCSTLEKPVLEPLVLKTQTETSSVSDDLIIQHPYFILNYNKTHRLANWVKYTLRNEDLNGPGKRPKKFKPDPLLKKMGIQPVSHDDYTNSGYNRGHLAPAEDFSKSQEAIDSTFIMSNVIPQKGIVNSGAWAQLEKKVRSWACGEKVITVITGPVLTSDLSKLKNSDISVPNEFYKIILDETPPLKLIAFKYNQFEKNQNIIKNKVSFTDVQTQDKLNLSTVKDSEVNDWKTCP